jgi:hypothetical protein
MSRFLRFAVFAAVCLSFCPLLLCQATTQQQVIVPYWTTEPGWNTQVEVRNNRRNGPVTVTPILRLASGREVPLSAISVDQSDSKPVDVGMALAAIMSANSESSPLFGSMLLRFDGGDPSNIFAAAIVRRIGSPIAFHFDALAGYQSGIPGSRETLWLLPTKTATTYVVATNTSRAASTARFVVSAADGKTVVADQPVAPGQSARVSVRDLLPDLSANAMGSVSVSMADVNPDFTVIAFAYDESSGFSAVSKVFERDPSEQSGAITLRAPMVALRQPSSALSFPADTKLQPRILLRNASDSAVAPQVSIRWQSPEGSGVSTVDSTSMQPGSLRLISLNDDAKPAIPPNANWAGVSIQYSGRYGDIVPITASYDTTGRYGTQTPFSATVAAAWEGGMWHADGATTNTVMTVGNGGRDTTTALLTLHSNGGKNGYEIQKQLGPGEQVWVDIGDLIRNQVADAKGSTISPDAMHGTYSIRDVLHKGGGYLFEGKINIDRTFGHAMYGCAICCGYSVPSMSPNPATAPVGGTAVQMSTLAYSNCFDTWDDLGGYNWGSTNSSIAAVDSNGLVSGIAVGSVTVSTSVDFNSTINRCPIWTRYPGGPVNVAPFITSITPAQGLVGNTVSVTIDGAGFGSAPTVNAPSGISISVQGVTNTRIVANFTIAINATEGITAFRLLQARRQAIPRPL